MLKRYKDIEDVKHPTNKLFMWKSVKLHIYFDVDVKNETNTFKVTNMTMICFSSLSELQ